MPSLPLSPRRPTARLLLAVGLLATGGWMVPPRTAPAAPLPALADPNRSGDLFSFPSPPLQPRQPRTEAETKGLQAAALFASGLIHARHGDSQAAWPLWEKALRLDPDNAHLRAAVLVSQAGIRESQQKLDQALTAYQRALRWAPGNKLVLQRIVQLARHLDRHTETARYSVLLAAEDPADSLEVLRAFLFLSDEQQLPRALKMFEHAVRRGKPDLQEPAWVELYKLAGEAYLARDNPRAAAEALAVVEDVLRRPGKYGLDPELTELIRGAEPAELDILIGRAYLAAGRVQEARAALDRGTQGSPGARWYWTARIEAAAHRPPQALAALQQYFDNRQSSQGAAPYRLLLEVEPAEGDQRIQRLEGLQAHDPDNASLAYFLAEQYVAAGRLREAEALFTGRLAQQPRVDAYRTLIRIHHQTKNHAAFLTSIGDVVARYSTLAVLGEALQTAAADRAFVEGVVAVARQQRAEHATKRAGQHPLALATLAVQAQRWEVAEEFYALAVAEDPQRREEIYEAWGLDLLAHERFAAAADVFRRAVAAKVVPENRPVFDYYLAGALAAEGKFDEAIGQARHAVEASPDTVDYLYRLAWVLYRAGRLAEARQTYAGLVQRFDSERELSGTRELVRESRLTLSHLWTLEDDWAQAEELLEQVLDEFPEDHGALNDLGYLWADRGVHLPQALKMIRRAVEAEPDNPAYRDSLGWVWYRLGQPERARAELQRAAELLDDEPDGVILEHLGDVYHALGQAAEARAAWQQALAAFAEEEDRAAGERVRGKLQPR